MDDAGRLLEEFLVEELALEETGLFTLSVQGPVEGDAGRVLVYLYPFLVTKEEQGVFS